MSNFIDHRSLADEMEIYFLNESIGAGLPMWLPNGVAIRPDEGTAEDWSFEQWSLRIRNGRLLAVPASPEELPPEYRALPPEYTTCRIFRWSACFISRSPGDRVGEDNASIAF